MHTAKQIREGSPAWQKFINNSDRLILAAKYIKVKNRPKPELREVK